MSDLIRRDDVYEALGITDKSTKYGGDHSGYDTLMLYEIKGAIDCIPTAEPKVGKWEIEEMRSIYGNGYRLTCSECGDTFTVTEDAFPNERYCRYCGAKMERSE